MSDYSIDDILAEVDSKRDDGKNPAGGRGDVDDILKDILGEPKKQERRISDAERRRLEKKAEAERLRAQQAAEKQRQAEEEARRIAAEAEARRRAKREEARRKAEAAAEAEKRRQEAEREAARMRAEAEAEKKRQAELAAKKAAEEAAEKQRLMEEAERRKAEEEARMAELLDEEERRKAEKEAEEKRRREEESERLYATKNIIFEDVPIELPKTSLTEEIRTQKPQVSTEEIELERSLRQQKVADEAQKLLIKDSKLEDPDDFLRSFNPYDLAKPTGFTNMIETLPAEQLAGDTKGVAGNELKDIARQTAKEDDRSVTMIVEGATTIMPDIGGRHDAPAMDEDKTLVLGDREGSPKPERNTKEIDAFAPKAPPRAEPKTAEEETLIRSINRTLEQNRIADKNISDALRPDTITAEQVKVPMATGPISPVGPLGTTMPRTGQIPISDPVIAEQKAKELAAKRKRRISGFVLEDITDDDFDLDDEEEEDDFDSSADDGQIWTDLTETHKGLRIRFILLLIITVFVGGITLLQEFGVTLQTELFGNEINFLDKRYDTEGFVFLNLILGIVGMALCSSVIANGTAKIFKGRSDCDSVCALSCVLSVAGAVLHLTNTDYLQRSRAFIYISVALAGLLFNTLGKLGMIVRAKKNFRAIAADGDKYYADIVDSQSEASAFTKGVVSELPYLVTMRKTEILTDFLRRSYCDDKADRTARRLVPLSLIIGVVMGLLAYLVPNGVDGMESNVYWATSVFIAVVCVMAPFSTMFMVNNPMRRATKALARSGCTLLGYTSAEEFGATNAVLTDAAALFPKSSIECTNLKPCKMQNSINNVSLDQSIILAASLAIKSGSILSSLFYDMIGGNKDLLVDIDGCVYEDNMGVMGWYGTKRLIMGNREHMKHHSIKVPEMSAIAKYCRNGSDSVYLAVGGELVIIFFIRLTANPKIRTGLRELIRNNVSIVVKTTDSIVTIGKIADLFDLDPEKTRIIGGNLHAVFDECTRYTSGGCGAMSLNGSFVSLSRGINAAKKLLRDVSMSHAVTVVGIFLALIFMLFLMFSVKTFVFSPAIIICWNVLWMLIMLFLQMFRKY